MNASYASPVADAAFAKISAIAPEGFVQRLLAGVNTWTVVLTLLIGAVLYDQGESRN
jgi:C-22 sterol desaturase